jgi:hypothetical protein
MSGPAQRVIVVALLAGGTLVVLYPDRASVDLAATNRIMLRPQMPHVWPVPLLPAEPQVLPRPYIPTVRPRSPVDTRMPIMRPDDHSSAARPLQTSQRGNLEEHWGSAQRPT